jgi:acyl-CoA dehydrogenase
MPDPAPAPAPGMDPEIFDQFIDQLKRYVRERLIPAEADVIANDRIPDTILGEMRDMGLFGITIPEAYGGAGMNVSQYIATVTQLSYAAPAYRSTMSINVGMTGSAIKNFGTAEQKAHWLPRIASGEIACFGLTEPGSGSDSAAMATMAVRDASGSGNGYVLNGTKRYITNSPHAKIGLIMARTSKEALAKNAHVSAFIVDMTTPGISIGSPDKKMGQAGAHIADVIIEDVHLPGDALVGGEEGKGFQIAMQSLDNGRLSVAGMSVGMGRRILDTATRYATERKAFGEAIANFQLIQAMLADSDADFTLLNAWSKPVAASPTAVCRFTAARAILLNMKPSAFSAMPASCASTKARRRSCSCKSPSNYCATLPATARCGERRTCIICWATCRLSKPRPSSPLPLPGSIWRRWAQR